MVPWKNRRKHGKARGPREFVFLECISTHGSSVPVVFKYLKINNVFLDPSQRTKFNIYAGLYSFGRRCMRLLSR